MEGEREREENVREREKKVKKRDGREKERERKILDWVMEKRGSCFLSSET